MVILEEREGKLEDDFNFFRGIFFVNVIVNIRKGGGFVVFVE